MGEVYRAHDTKLKRDVALKVLPESFVSDADRVIRFRREAEVLAALNHPNIAAIYGAEEDAGIQALVLELVEGETLADRLGKGPIPLEDSLKIAIQIDTNRRSGRLIESVMHDVNTPLFIGNSGAAQFSVSASGTWRMYVAE